MYESAEQLKEELTQKISHVTYDRAVYGKAQLFRMPYREEASKEGIYNIFYTYGSTQKL